MTILKVSDVKQYLSTQEDDSTISLENLEYLVKKTCNNKVIVQTIKSCIDNYTPYNLKEQLVTKLKPEGIVSELIPTISLGRRAGHTTAIVNYSKQTKDKNIFIITYSDFQVQEIVNLFNPKACFKNDRYYKVSDNVFVMNSTSAARNISRIAPKDSVILFDSSVSYKDPEFTPIISDLYLNHSVIFLGN